MNCIRVFLCELRLYLCNHIINKIPSHTLRLAFYRHVMGFELAKGVAIHLGARFDCARGLTIGETSVINENCRLDCRGGITIGDNVGIAAETIILTADHDPSTPDIKGRAQPVVLDDFVFTGTRVLILPGVTLHRGSIAAAGAVVTQDVPPFEIVGGVPARKIGMRNPELHYSTSFSRLLH